MVCMHMISCLCITQVGILVFLVGYNTICTLSAQIFHIKSQLRARWGIKHLVCGQQGPSWSTCKTRTLKRGP